MQRFIGALPFLLASSVGLAADDTGLDVDIPSINTVKELPAEKRQVLAEQRYRNDCLAIRDLDFRYAAMSPATTFVVVGGLPVAPVAGGAVYHQGRYRETLLLNGGGHALRLGEVQALLGDRATSGPNRSPLALYERDELERRIQTYNRVLATRVLGPVEDMPACVVAHWSESTPACPRGGRLARLSFLQKRLPEEATGMLDSAWHPLEAIHRAGYPICIRPADEPDEPDDPKEGAGEEPGG